MLEELGIKYRMIPVNISKGEQFTPKFLTISPNNRMPAIVDHNPPPEYDGKPVTIFESGAILLLARKTGKFLPPPVEKNLEWLFWQVGNLGPMAGQHSHFWNYADGEHEYAATRYANEYNRHRRVRTMAGGRDWLAGAPIPSPTWQAGRGS